MSSSFPFYGLCPLTCSNLGLRSENINLADNCKNSSMRCVPTQDNTNRREEGNIHASTGIRIHDLSGQAIGDSTRLWPRGCWDRFYLKFS
jgi:hypothetical protein